MRMNYNTTSRTKVRPSPTPRGVKDHGESRFYEIFHKMGEEEVTRRLKQARREMKAEEGSRIDRIIAESIPVDGKIVWTDHTYFKLVDDWEPCHTPGCKEKVQLRIEGLLETNGAILRRTILVCAKCNRIHTQVDWHPSSLAAPY